MKHEISNVILFKYHDAIRQPVLDQLYRTPTDITGYIARHRKAWHTQECGIERAIRLGIESLADMAADYEARLGSTIGSDYVLGEYWLGMAKGLKGMLDGETGALDCGFCSAAIRNLAELAGFNEEDL